jgi:hypothetical protein
MVGLLARTSAVAQAHLWRPPAPRLCPTMVTRLGEAPIVVGWVREALGRLGDGGGLQRGSWHDFGWPWACRGGFYRGENDIMMRRDSYDDSISMLA